MLRLLALRPVENVFVGSRIRAAGVEASSLGCPIWGYERDGELRSLCHAGANLVPVNADPDAVAAWTEFAGPERMCFSIIGPSAVALDLWRQLSERWGTAWSRGARRPTAAAGDGDLGSAPGRAGSAACAGWGWSTGTATTRPR